MYLVSGRTFGSTHRVAVGSRVAAPAPFRLTTKWIGAEPPPAVHVSTTLYALGCAATPTGGAGAELGLMVGVAPASEPPLFAIASVAPMIAITPTLATIATIVARELGPGGAGSPIGARGVVGWSGGGGIDAIVGRCITAPSWEHPPSAVT